MSLWLRAHRAPAAYAVQLDRAVDTSAAPPGLEPAKAGDPAAPIAQALSEPPQAPGAAAASGPAPFHEGRRVDFEIENAVGTYDEPLQNYKERGINVDREQ